MNLDKKKMVLALRSLHVEILATFPSGLCVIGPETHEPCIDALHHSSVIVGYVELLR